jgi:osmotically-inducible protein OsmY
MALTEARTDHRLKAAITDELARTPSVDADRIGVALAHGVVTVSGQVESYPEKQKALRAVLGVAGVTAVADEMVVDHAWGATADADIAREATEALDRTDLPPGSVQATVHDQVITLSGAVDWQCERAATGLAVAMLRGVRGVRNAITLNKPAEQDRPSQRC